MRTFTLKGDGTPDVQLMWFDDGLGVAIGTHTASGFMIGEFELRPHTGETYALRNDDAWSDERAGLYALRCMQEACNKPLT